MTRIKGLFIAATTVAVLSACGATDSSPLDDSRPADVGTVDTSGALPDVGGVPDPDVCRGASPDVDTDGDGLPDAIEDRDRDCRVDDDETDPHAWDTDGDGLSDGAEDIDGNGQHDAARGELDPRRSDTDGDGVSDAEEDIAIVCTPDLILAADAHRIPLEDGTMLFVHPSSEVYLVGASAVVARGDELAMLAPAGAAGLDNTLLVTLFSEAVASLGGVLNTVSEHRPADSTLWVADYAVELDGARRVEEVAGALASATGVDLPAELFEPVDAGEEDDDDDVTQPRRRFRLHVEAELGPYDVVDGRLAVSVSGAPDPEPWFALHGVAAIAPDARSTVRPMCETLAAEQVASVDIVMVVDTSPSLAMVRDEMAVAIASLVDARWQRGLETRVWPVAADGHVAGAAGGVIGGDAAVSADGLLSRMSSISWRSDDQRAWHNARALLERETVDGDRVVLVMVTSREDVEFREGEYAGFDGTASGAPLPRGSERAARTSFYRDEVASRATVVAVTPGPRVDGGARCVTIGTAEQSREAPIDPGTSYRDVALATGGYFVDVCDPDVRSSVERLSDGLFGAGGVARLFAPALPGSVRVAVDGAELDVVAFRELSGIGDERAVRVTDAVEGTELGAAYLFWDDATSATAASE